uniref:Uncharacterized protein n=1 Tax=Triticum urartu TaxID=4572 RepID=A0A8R7TK01_TRIUA
MWITPSKNSLVNAQILRLSLIGASGRRQTLKRARNLKKGCRLIKRKWLRKKMNHSFEWRTMTFTECLFAAILWLQLCETKFQTCLCFMFTPHIYCYKITVEVI